MFHTLYAITMILNLHAARISLESADQALRQEWQALFTGWLDDSAVAVDMRLRLRLCAELPSLPPYPPFFHDDDDRLSGEGGILSVYGLTDEAVLLHFLDGAQVRVPLQTGAPAVVEGMLLAQALQHGRFEDITFTSLAPLLRRRGYYLAHAFAASKDGCCALIVGPSGSGKTTTGLALLAHGWQLLANDVVLLQERNGRIYALPTPGMVHIRAYTFHLLPHLRRLLPQPDHPVDMSMAAQILVHGRWAPPAPITHLYFPLIEQRLHTTLRQQNRAVALACLMSESIDRWDERALSAHMTILQKLVYQADAYVLHLGQWLEEVPALLACEPGAWLSG